VPRRGSSAPCAFEIAVNPGLGSLQARLGHSFADAALLERALTHKSFGPHHNERLEFLGDAVLAAAVSGMLYRRFAQSDEGELTRIRAHLVREEMLHRLALELELPLHLRLSDGEARSGGAQRASILADALEALIGAVYLDGGFDAASDMVERLFAPLVASTAAQGWSRDPKTELQEWLQARRQPVPTYRIEATSGRQHEQSFVVVCSVPAAGLEARGEGRSRRVAEQDAARSALATLKGGEPPSA
jgi:ribonuclease-3